MGNCFCKTKINPEPQSSDGDRVKNGGWKRKIAKRLGLAKFSARVDVVTTDGTDVDSSAVSAGSAGCLPTSEGLRDTNSVLVLFYARAEGDEGTDVDKVEPAAPQGSLLAQQSSSPYFSSEESLYEEFADTGNDIEEDISDEANVEHVECSTPSNTSASDAVREDNCANAGDVSKEITTVVDKSDYVLEKPKSLHKEAKTENVKCHFFASNGSTCKGFGKEDNSVEEDIPEEIPEETPANEDTHETDLEMPDLRICTGTGNVAIGKDAIDAAIKRIHDLKSVRVDLTAARKDKNAEESIVRSKPNVSNYHKNTKAVIGSSTKSSPSGIRELTWTTNKSSLKCVRSAESRQNVVNDELKRKVSLTSAKSLEALEAHQDKSDCMLNIFVRPADPDDEPKPIQVRATSQQVKDGAAKMFLKTLDHVTESATHFDPLKKPKKKSKRHRNKTTSSLVRSEENHTVYWTQKSGTVSDVQLTRVPLFYEPSPKRQNAREKIGLERLQKHNIQIQCKEIERIKVGEDLFPGILPPELQEKLNQKRQEKKLVN